ncbi:MAG: diguanylate cyclase [Thermoleophilia bacterium]|nr:diguanylate cyclase [Thermoleophilia bacterium]
MDPGGGEDGGAPHGALSERAELHALRAVLSSTGAYVFTKDRDCRYTYVNRLVAELFGRSPAEVVGCTDEDFFDLEASGGIRRNDMEVMAGGVTVTAEERNVVRETGDELYYLSVKTPLRDTDGEVIGLCGISTDITRQKELEHAFIEQRALLGTVIENVDASIYVKHRDGRYRYVNALCARILGRSPDEIIGRRDDELHDPETAARITEMDRRTFERQQKQSGEEQLVLPDGTTGHFWSTKMPLGHVGRPDELIGFSSDVTEMHELRKDLERQAFTDGLTGVATRRYLMLQAEHELEQSRRHGWPLALIALDIDHFKKVNDAHRHAGGDAVLVAVAQHCAGLVRDADLVGRIGGEEFAVMLVNTGLDGAMRLAERLRREVAALQVTLPTSGTPVRCTISLGVSAFDPAHDGGAHGRHVTIDELLDRADTALYVAKAEGRNRVRAAPRA